MDSPEFKSLKKCYPTLVSCIQQSPDDIATQLVPLDLLPRSVFSTLSSSHKNNVEKALDILGTVLFQVQTDSSVFQSFIAALTAAGPWTKSTVNELQKEFNSYEQSQQPPPLQHTDQGRSSVVSWLPRNPPCSPESGWSSYSAIIAAPPSQ